MLKVQVPSELVHGEVEQGYGPVADEFRRNFAERGEIGAAVTVYRDGEKVVDLWGGYRDGVERSPWERDTLVNVFSTTKGIASMAIAVAHSRGLLDYDAPVATYWPEFAASGKQQVTVRQLLSHQAGLAAIDRPLGLDTLADLDLLADALAEQAPAWEPGARHGYHGVTLGWYEGELLRRVDPGRRSLGRFFADEIAAPLGIEFYIGVPDDLEASRGRCVRSHGDRRGEARPHARDPVGADRTGAPARRGPARPRCCTSRPPTRSATSSRSRGCGSVPRLARRSALLAPAGRSGSPILTQGSGSPT